MAQRIVLISIATPTVSHAMEIHGFSIDVHYFFPLRPFLHFLSLLVFLWMGCSPRRSDRKDESINVTPLSSTIEVSDLNPYISDLDLLFVGGDSSYFSGISKLLVSDKFYALSGGVVFSFSKNGSDVLRIGDVGRGPGEYLSIKDICFSFDKIELWCLDLNNTLLRFNAATATYLGKVDLGMEIGYAKAVLPIDDDKFSIFIPNPIINPKNGDKDKYCIRTYDLSGTEIDRSLRLDTFNVEAGFSIPVTLADSLHYILSPGTRPVLYVFDSGVLQTQYFIDFDDKSIPSNYFNSAKEDPWLKVGPLFKLDCFKLISSVYYSGTNVYFSAFGKDSSRWNFYVPVKGEMGIRWESVGSAAPPMSAIASDGEYLYFPYDDYGFPQESSEKDPLKRVVIERLGIPVSGHEAIIKIKFDVK